MCTVLQECKYILHEDCLKKLSQRELPCQYTREVNTTSIKEYRFHFPSLSRSLQALSVRIWSNGHLELPVPENQTVAITYKHASFKSNIYCLKLQILLRRLPRSMKRPLFASGNQHGCSRLCSPCSCRV